MQKQISLLLLILIKQVNIWQPSSDVIFQTNPYLKFWMSGILYVYLFLKEPKYNVWIF